MTNSAPEDAPDLYTGLAEHLIADLANALRRAASHRPGAERVGCVGPFEAAPDGRPAPQRARRGTVGGTTSV